MKKSIILPAFILLILISRFFFSGAINRLLGIDLAGSGRDAYFLYQAVWYLLPILVVMMIVHRPLQFSRELGLAGGFLKGAALAAVFTFPMFAVYALLGDWPDWENIAVIAFTSLFAGFFEELFFRGFVFGQLFYGARWGFIPAVLTGGIFFGLGHLYQSRDFLSAAMVFGITLMGSVWFSWLYAEAGKSLWLPIFLHTLMNLAWGLFSIDDTAMGNWLANLPRIITIALSILYIVIFVRKQGPLTVRRSNLWVNRTGQNGKEDPGQG